MIIKPIESVNASLNKIPIVKGQLITTTDTKTMYMDTSENERIQLGDMFLINTESEREMMLAPLPFKLYLVKETSKLYVYNSSEWIDLFKSNVAIKRTSYELSNDATEVQLNIPEYDKTRDTLIIYLNSVYLNEDTDYTISVDNKLKPVRDTVWKALPDAKAIFNVILFKNISKLDSELANSAAVSNFRMKASEIDSIKKENALLLHTLMINDLNLSSILNYEKINDLYISGLWDRSMVSTAYEKHIISEEEKNKILSI